MPHHLAARLTQIDYEREMAFGLFLPAPGDRSTSGAFSHDTMVGIVHLVMTPDRDSAEVAVMVRSDMKGKGLGYFMMNHIIAYAETQGVGEIQGHVQRNNAAMLSMSRELGFSIARDRVDGTQVQVSRKLAVATDA